MRNYRVFARAIGLLSLLTGLGILVYIIFPLVSYEILARARFSSYLSPVPHTSGLSDIAVRATDGRVGTDYTKASNWFEGANLNTDSQGNGVRFYTIDIPKLDIENATVSIGGEDLSESLIQYPGTALPGKRGNGVIFGHSIHPRFYNPSDYLAIFSLLPTLDPGDEMSVAFDGINYRYQIEEMFEVRPQDVYILEQREEEPYLYLVTCTPPGHPLRPKRLVVKARIVSQALVDEDIRN